MEKLAEKKKPRMTWDDLKKYSLSSWDFMAKQWGGSKVSGKYHGGV